MPAAVLVDLAAAVPGSAAVEASTAVEADTAAADIGNRQALSLMYSRLNGNPTFCDAGVGFLAIGGFCLGNLS